MRQPPSNIDTTKMGKSSIKRKTMQSTNSNTADLKGLSKLSATIQELEEAHSRAIKPRLVRRDFVGMSGGKNFGPATVPRRSFSQNDPTPINKKGKFFIEGQGLTAIKNTPAISNKKIAIPTGKKERAAAHRGANALLNMHEAEEMRHLSTPLHHSPRSSAGVAYGHHSLSKVLGAESNNIINGDKTIKAGGKILKQFRTNSGEKEAYNQFALKNSKGEQPFTYGHGRTSRAYRKAMLKKELGLPLSSTKKDIRDTSKRIYDAALGGKAEATPSRASLARVGRGSFKKMEKDSAKVIQEGKGLASAPKQVGARHFGLSKMLRKGLSLVRRAA